MENEIRSERLGKGLMDFRNELMGVTLEEDLTLEEDGPFIEGEGVSADDELESEKNEET
jgi:hypothetical protein